MRIGFFLFVNLALLCSSSAPAHPGDPESRVTIEFENASPIAVNPTQVAFRLRDHNTQKWVTSADLQVTHERLLHMLVYDPALADFQHVHPESVGDSWRVSLRFAARGNFWVWTQGQLQDGEEFSPSTRLQVALSELPENPAPPLLTDVREGADRGSLARLSGEKLWARRLTTLTVTLGRTDGSAPDLQPYLGAFAHIIAVTREGDSLLHVHPMDGLEPTEGLLHTQFPFPGHYRLWIQFLDAGLVRTVPLSVQVF